ncbi:MAG TPA: hypothetical protein PKM25_12775 [Candidatus Ozemobacteraceae bacterium]|nr:hypothetical protein [Candidatus Ozemobacteraceae bacterium]
MIDPKTMNGLDEAIADLNKTIESLPEGSLKRQLSERFNRMRNVRDHLGDKAVINHPRSPLPYILFGFGLAIAMIVVWKTRPTCR